jgi:N-acetylmuramoyl-L-alanine amidase
MVLETKLMYTATIKARNFKSKVNAFFALLCMMLITGTALAAFQQQSFVTLAPDKVSSTLNSSSDGGATLLQPLKGKTIVINPGHGGKDSGAVYGGVEEKNVTLAIALKVRDLLTALGANVIMTRTSDVTMPLPEIDSVTSAVKPDAFLAIHCNAGGKNMHGVESFYFYPESSRYASIMLRSVSQKLGKPANFTHYNNFYVIDHTRVPAALVEVGYLSNRRDRAYLTNSQDQELIATALAEGMVQYFSPERS